jgi:hypothetical protein
MVKLLRGLSVAGVALVIGVGCRTAFDAGGKHGLPPARPEATNFSSYQPAAPLVVSKNGVATRSVFTAASGEGYEVEVRDVLVSPREPAVDLEVSGGAVVEVRQGAGEATAGGRTTELRQGTVFTVAEGEPLRLSARGGPLALRLWIARAR